jgi:hypothetical protein
MRRACALTLSPRSFALVVQSLQPTPSPLCGLAPWPLPGAFSMYPGGVFLDLRYPVTFSHRAADLAIQESLTSITEGRSALLLLPLTLTSTTRFALRFGAIYSNGLPLSVMFSLVRSFAKKLQSTRESPKKADF